MQLFTYKLLLPVQTTWTTCFYNLPEPDILNGALENLPGKLTGKMKSTLSEMLVLKGQPVNGRKQLFFCDATDFLRIYRTRTISQRGNRRKP